MENAKEDITFDETVFLILKAVDKPLTITEIIFHLYDWELSEMERKGEKGRPKRAKEGEVRDALIMLCFEKNVKKQYRHTPQNSPWSLPQALTPLREYCALRWPERI